jgi:hypothetical protein
MLNVTKIACAIALPLLIYGCQSSSTHPTLPKAAGRQPPPAPAAWIMQPYAPRLDLAHAQRIIAITNEGDRGLIALQACQAYVRALVPAHFE